MEAIDNTVKNLIIYSLESGIILLLLYGFYYFLLKKETSFGFNRRYLIAAPFFAVLIPLISIPLISLSKAAPENQLFLFQSPEIEVPFLVNDSSYFFVEIMTVILMVYIFGFFYFLSRLIYQIISLKKYFNSKKYVQTNWNGYQVINTNGESPTFCFYRTIFFNNNPVMSLEERETILLHESIHVKELHSIDILVSEVLCIVFWFNPLLILFKKAIQQNHEYIADLMVLSEGNISVKNYKKILALNCLKSSSLSIGTYFNKSQTLNRIQMMNLKPKRIDALKLACLLSLILFATFIFACEKNEEKLAEELQEQSNTIGDNKEFNKELTTSEELFTVVDTQPSFKGQGNAAFMEYIGENIKYPAEDINNKIEGKVFIQFVVEKDGTLSNIEVLKNEGSESMGKEAVRVIENSPLWIPGKQREEAVRVRIIIPINFQMS